MGVLQEEVHTGEHVPLPGFNNGAVPVVRSHRSMLCIHFQNGEYAVLGILQGNQAPIGEVHRVMQSPPPSSWTRRADSATLAT